MTKKALVFLLALVMMVAFTLPLLADEVVTGKVQTYNKGEKKISIQEALDK